MADYMMKEPIEPCPTDGWSILDAMANCCTSWQETVERTADGSIFQKKLRLPTEKLAWFNELRMICELGMLEACGRRGDPAALPDDIPSVAWQHYELVDAYQSTLRTPEGNIVYDVKLRLPEVRRKRGRPAADEWIRSHLKDRYSSESLKEKNSHELRKIAAQMLMEFARTNDNATLNATRRPNALARRTAEFWVIFYSKHGLETTRKRRAGSSAKIKR